MKKYDFPIIILLLMYLVFVLGRYITLMYFPAQSYAYYKVSCNPEYLLTETFLLYTTLIFIFIIGYYVSIINIKSYNNNTVVIKETKTKYSIIVFLFFLMISISLFRSIILGETVGGGGRHPITKMIFFLDWIMPLSLLYIYLVINSKAKVILLISIIYAISIIINGMKGGLLLPFITIFFSFIYLGKIKFKFRQLIKITLIFLLVVSIFPFVFNIVGMIRGQGQLDFAIIFQESQKTLSIYESLIGKLITYIYRRLSEIEPLQIILQYYSNIDRSQINTYTFLVHIYNAFVPSFMESNNMFLKFSANKIYPIIFFDMGENVLSSEGLTIPGVFVFYFGYIAPIFIFFFGLTLGWVNITLNNLKDRTLSQLFSIFFIVSFYKLIHSGSIEHVALAIKQSVSFLLFYKTMALFVKTYSKKEVSINLELH